MNFYGGSGLRGGKEGPSEGEGAAGGFDIVDPKEMSTGQVGENEGNEGAFQPFLRGQATEKVTDKGFAGGADEDGAAKFAKEGDVFEEGEVVLKLFSEADAGVKDDAIRGVAEGIQRGDALNEESPHFAEQIVILGVLLHRFGGALDVLNDDRGMGIGEEGGHIGVHLEAGDVIDEIGAGGDGFSRDCAFDGIYGDGDIGAVPESANDGDDAGEFKFRGDGVGAGAGGFAANVQQVGALFNRLETRSDGGISIREPGAGVERIWCHIDDRHNVEGEGLKCEGAASNDEGRRVWSLQGRSG